MSKTAETAPQSPADLLARFLCEALDEAEETLGDEFNFQALETMKPKGVLGAQDITLEELLARPDVKKRFESFAGWVLEGVQALAKSDPHLDECEEDAEERLEDIGDGPYCPRSTVNSVGPPWYNGAMRKPDLQVPTHNANKFSWDADRKGATEASDLGPAGTTWFSRVWTDACDEGFIVRSDRTGTEKLFTLVDTERREGDVVKWLFVSEDGFTATVYND